MQNLISQAKRKKGEFEEVIRTWSIRQSLKENRLMDTYNQLTQIVPDISEQYTEFRIDDPYYTTKVRGMHVFQTLLANKAIELFGQPKNQNLTIVDIGDSAGTHLQYILNLNKSLKIRCLSINSDEKAVERIKAKGLEAVCGTIEDLKSQQIEADIFMCFETLEHLMDPCRFLKEFSFHQESKFLVITVPYLAQSRVGLHHIREGNMKTFANPENTHIFELSPDDWRLIFQHSGWKVEYENIYYQYARKSIFQSLFRKHWQKRDFEGFYGVILSHDPTWRDRFVGWY